MALNLKVLKKITLALAGVFFVLLLGFFFLRTKLLIASGYAAKTLCAEVLVSGHWPQVVQEQKLNFFPANVFSYEVNQKAPASVVSAFGPFFKRVALHSPAQGCVLLPLNAHYPTQFSWGPRQRPEKVRTLVKKINPELEKKIDQYFTEKQNTFAILVLENNQIVAEKYAPGTSEKTLFLGWSLTKSIWGALFGVLAKQNKIKLETNHLFESWEGDERKNITVKEVLSMNTGLKWSEDYEKVSEVTRMLFLEPNMPGFVENLPLQYKIGEKWVYASGSSNLLSSILKKVLMDPEAYENFAQKELFKKLGMDSALMEKDASGQFVASSYVYATAQDWAKLGLLYLNQGKVGQTEIFTKDWFEKSIAPVPGSEGQYGLHIWLNQNQKKYPDAPKNMIYFSGYRGQKVFILPDQNRVIVRMGHSKDEDFDFNAFLKDLISL